MGRHQRSCPVLMRFGKEEHRRAGANEYSVEDGLRGEERAVRATYARLLAAVGELPAVAEDAHSTGPPAAVPYCAARVPRSRGSTGPRLTTRQQRTTILPRLPQPLQLEVDVNLTPQALQPDEGDALWFFGMLVLIKIAGESTGGQFCLVEQRGRRGVATPLHLQVNDQETFYVLEGELQFYLDGHEPLRASAGATVYVPAGAPHAFEVLSDTARWLDFTTPNHEAFFRAAGEPARELAMPPDMPPDMEKVMAAAGRYEVAILGPPPGTPR